MKKTLILVCIVSLGVACGSSSDSKATAGKDTAATVSTDASSQPAGSVANEKGLELIGASDCMTCHKLREKNIGPAYSDVAEKYKDVPHAVDTLVQKVIKGGSGHWGVIPMTPHPALQEADVREMVTYVLSLKK